MKKKIIILISILFVSAIAVVTASAVFDTDKLFTRPDTIEETSEYSNNVAKTLQLTTPTGQQADISYVETTKNDIHELDVYRDQEGNEYSFTKAGEKISYLKLHTADPDKALTSEKELSSLALKCAENYFGDQFDNFELAEFTVGSQNGDFVETYLATFAKKYGAGAFIRGEVCYVTIASDGVVISCMMPNFERLKGFDPESVANITYSELSAYIDSIVKETYGTDLKEYNIDQVSITKSNEKFVLVIYVEMLDENNIPSLKEYYYEIPQ